MQTNPAPTRAQLRALLWLKNRGGEGTFETNRQVLVAAGNRAPIDRRTWNALHGWGLVEIFAEGSRVRLSPVGKDWRFPATLSESEGPGGYTMDEE